MPASVPTPWIVAGALLVEGALGWPRRLSHPVVWIGGLIATLERCWNCAAWSAKSRRALGVLTVLILVVVAVAVVAGLYWGMGRQETVQTTTSPAVTPPRGPHHQRGCAQVVDRVHRVPGGFVGEGNGLCRL